MPRARERACRHGRPLVIIALSALMLAWWPILAVVLAAQVLHARASCVLGPAIAAISLGLVGHYGISERLGRNACFASIGNGLAAAAMGACGYFLSSQRGLLSLRRRCCIPALIALSHIRERRRSIRPAPTAASPDRSHGELAAEWAFCAHR